MTDYARIMRMLVTLMMLAIAIFVLVQVWYVYIQAPWTRDGRVWAQTVVVAPEVSGTVVDVPLVENQIVHKGDVLFRLDPSRFDIALAQAQAQLAAAQLQQTERKEDEARRQGLNGLISNEERLNAGLDANIAEASVQAAQSAVDLAQLNLVRSTVYAPVTGYVTHLRLQAGDYADAGKPVVTVLDSSSFQIIAYFEETKLDQIHENQPASIKLMGYPQRLSGHVLTIGRGISDENGDINELGLPVINPVFDWVRLAQRIPVDISIDTVPNGVILASGMTCSVDLGAHGRAHSGIAGRLQRWLEDSL
jgi:multidrug resistance efflux pump